MPSIQYLGLVLLAATGAVAIVNQPKAPQLNVETTYGCYSDPGDLIMNGTNIYNTMGGCATKTCKPLNYTVAATSGGNECWCGFKYPSKKYRIDDSECDIPCVGYPDLEACKFARQCRVWNW